MKNIFFKTLMLKGEPGGTINKIEKTSTSGLVDTYTITYDDGETSTFEVTNGNGIVSIEHTSSSGYFDTYTITYDDGDTDTFTIKNGEDGAGYEVPTGSVVYFDSSDAIPEGYEAATNPEASRLPCSIYASEIDLAFASGVASVTLSTLGLSGATILMAQAAPNYASSSLGANCFCTCQKSVTGLNIYIRDGYNNTIPSDGTYTIALLIAYN